MAYEFNLDFLKKRIAPQRNGPGLTPFLPPLVAPKTPEEYAQRNGITPAGVGKPAASATPASSEGGAMDMGVGLDDLAQGIVGPRDTNAIYRIGNTFTNVPTDIDAARAAGVSVTPTTPLTGQGGVSTAGGGSFSTVPSAAGLDPALAAQLSAALGAAADRGDFDAVANSYRVNGGTFNGKTQAQVDDEGRMKSVFDAVNNAKTSSRLTSATQVLAAMLGLQGDREKTAATTAAAQANYGLNVQKFLADLFTKGATARKTDLESASLAERQRLAEQAKTRGASEAEVSAILSGRGGGTPTALQNAVLPGATEVPVFDPRTRTITSTPIQKQSPIYRDPVNGQPYKMEGGKKIPLTPDEAKAAGLK